MMDDQGDMLTVNRMQADSQGEMRKLKGKELRKMCPKPCPGLEALVGTASGVDSSMATSNTIYVDPTWGCPFTCPDWDGLGPRLKLGTGTVELYEIDNEADKGMLMNDKKKKYCPQYCGPAPAEFPPADWDGGAWPTEVGGGASCWSMCPDGIHVRMDESDECPAPVQNRVACPNIVMTDEKGHTCSGDIPTVADVTKIHENCPSQCLSEMNCATGTLADSLHYPEYKCAERSWEHCEPDMTPPQCDCQLTTPFCPEKCVDKDPNSRTFGSYIYHEWGERSDDNVYMSSEWSACPKYCLNDEWRSELPSSGSGAGTGMGFGYGSGHDHRELAWEWDDYACSVPCRNSDRTVMMNYGWPVTIKPVRWTYSDDWMTMETEHIPEGEALATMCPVQCAPPEGGCGSDNSWMCEMMGWPEYHQDSSDGGTQVRLSDDEKREQYCPKFCSSPTEDTTIIWPYSWREGERCPHHTTTTTTTTTYMQWPTAGHDDCTMFYDEYMCGTMGCTWNWDMWMCESGRQDYDQRQPTNDDCYMHVDEWACMPPCSWNHAMYTCESGRQADGDCHAYTNEIVCPKSSCTWNAASYTCEHAPAADSSVRGTTGSAYPASTWP
jgi:hypothetical protein